MKRITLFISVFLGLLLSVSVPQQVFALEKIDNPDITVGVDGMVCPFCAYGVTKKLERIDEVDAVYVRIDNGTADLKLKEGLTLSETKIKKVIDEAGYEVRSIEYHNKATKKQSQRNPKLPTKENSYAASTSKKTSVSIYLIHVNFAANAVLKHAGGRLRV